MIWIHQNSNFRTLEISRISSFWSFWLWKLQFSFDESLKHWLKIMRSRNRCSWLERINNSIRIYIVLRMRLAFEKCFSNFSTPCAFSACTHNNRAKQLFSYGERDLTFNLFNEEYLKCHGDEWIWWSAVKISHREREMNNAKNFSLAADLDKKFSRRIFWVENSRLN